MPRPKKPAKPKNLPQLTEAMDEATHHLLFDHKPGETGVVAIGKSPRGERYGVTHGATLEEALTRLRAGARAVMVAMAEDGEFPLAILAPGRSEHFEADFPPEELIPIVRRYLQAPGKRPTPEPLSGKTLSQLLEAVDATTEKSLKDETAGALEVLMEFVEVYEEHPLLLEDRHGDV